MSNAKRRYRRRRRQQWRVVLFERERQSLRAAGYVFAGKVGAHEYWHRAVPIPDWARPHMHPGETHVCEVATVQ